MCCSPDECRQNSCCYLLIFGIITGVFAFIGMLCLTAGYYNNKNFNEQQVPGTCTVESMRVESARCSYNCNCDADGHCATCYYTCYNGVIAVSIPLITESSEVGVVAHMQTTGDVIMYLHTNYPIGKSFGCYYNKDVNTTGSVEVQLGLRDYMTPYNVGLAFCGLALGTILVFIIFIAYGFLPLLFECIGDSFAGCRSNIRRYNDRKRAARQAAKQRKLDDIEKGQLQASDQSSVGENDIQSSTPGSSVQPSHMNEYDVAPLPSAPAVQQPEPEALPSAPPLRESELNMMTE